MFIFWLHFVSVRARERLKKNTRMLSLQSRSELIQCIIVFCCIGFVQTSTCPPQQPTSDKFTQVQTFNCKEYKTVSAVVQTSVVTWKQCSNWGWKNGSICSERRYFYKTVNRDIVVNKEYKNVRQCINGYKNINGLCTDIAIRVEFKNQFLYLDATSAIPCIATGVPKPTVTWQKNGFQLSAGLKYDMSSNNSLVIKDIKSSDGGTYTCIASNRIDTVSKSAEVFIVTPTRITRFAPREFPVTKGTSPRLPCDVEHDPRVNYTREWRFNNHLIRSSHYVLQRDGSLMVNHVQSPRDTDIDFSCHIFADDGNFTYTTTLELINFPLQPSSPKVIDVQSFELTINWDAPSDGGSALTGFVLYMKNITMSRYNVLARLNASETTFVIKNLRAGAMYRFQVVAENKFGPGERSAESIWIETKTLAPSGSPKKFRSLEAGTDYVKIAWERPNEAKLNGKLLGYNIGYRVAGYEGEDSFVILHLVDDTKTEYEMRGLPLFTKYEVKVAAYNKAGRGPWSETKYVETLQGVPLVGPTGVTVAVENSTTVVVNFNSPPQSLWNGQLRTIIARYWPPEFPPNQKQYRTNYDASSIHMQSFLLPNLEADKEYALTVAVGTSGGLSPGSSTVRFRTKPGKPEQVQDMQISNTYADAFTVTWKPPIKTGGTIIGYLIKYRVFSSQKWRELKEHGKALGAVVPNLQPKTKYEVEVAAMTSAGQGPLTRRSALTGSISN